MANVFVKFTSSSATVNSGDCTTRWDDDIECSIPMSGLHESKYTNLMKMVGDADKIAAWLEKNKGKVEELTEAQINIIGQTMVPENTIRIIEEDEEDKVYRKTYIAGEFTMTSGQTWTLTDQEDITHTHTIEVNK